MTTSLSDDRLAAGEVRRAGRAPCCAGAYGQRAERTKVKRAYLVMVAVVAVGVRSPATAGAGAGPTPPQHGAMTALSSVPVQTKAVALTFDLGCSARRQPLEGMLLCLERRGVHCTWFLTGWFVRHMPDLVGRLAARGDDLANHTDTHPHCRGLSRSRLQRELLQVEHLLTAAGYEMTSPKYFRPPFGEYDGRVMEVAAGLGYRTVLWSATTADYDLRSDPRCVARSVLARCRPGAIILMHATEVSQRALPILLDGLMRKGYWVGSLRGLIDTAHAQRSGAQGYSGGATRSQLAG